MSDFVEEPEKTTQEIRPTRLVKYAEFTIHTEDTHPILPPNSILVDLPGGAAGQPRHDMILREELNTTDAVILVVNSIRGGDDKETQHIFEQVKNKFVQDKGDKAASLMAFLVVTRWEEIRTQGEQNRIRKSMEKLLSKLPENYSHYHTHGGEKAFFYQLRVLDALIASLASNLATVGTIREQEGKEYLATVRTLYHRLRPIAEQLAQVPLSETFTAEQIQHVPPALHKAMLEFTGFAELGRDLQAFLARDRYDAQLTQARRDIDHALRLLEDVCRKHLHDLGFRNRTLQGLQQEKGRRQKQQDQILLKDLESHIYKMYTSWEDALKQFENRVYIEFPINLDEAYHRAKRAVENRIWQGIFDEFIETNAQRDRNPTRLEQDLTDVRCQALIDRLRMSFMVIMEREVSAPATTLARTFLNPIEDKEAEGSLDIRKVALGEIGDELDLVEQLYKDIKDKISLMANDICRF